MGEIDTPPARAFPSLERLRERAGRKVESIGLQRVARSVGMGHESLKRFLEGGSIRNQSRHNLFEWLAAQDAPPELGAIVQDLPVRYQRVAVGEILQVLRKHHLAATGTVPAWLRGGPQEFASESERTRSRAPARR